MRQFAEEEIVLPSGPFEGLKFRTERQPFARLWFDAIDSGLWRRFAVTGCGQSGKTLCGSTTPALYHLFEIGETVVYGVPIMDMAADKWREDFLPVIERTRYRDLLPTSGAASRGGDKALAIRFKNGATLRFMTGGGRDKTRAGFTSRVVVITEVDGMDQAAEKSREADPIKQIEARTRAFGDRARVYMECTVSIEEGRIWREYKGGTESKIVRPCPLCKAWVTPEREHLQGWQKAETERLAEQSSAFACYACGVVWTEEERRQANSQSKLLHRGQEITPEGMIVGPMPETHTLGFRWSAVDNQLVPPGVVGATEWKAERDPNQDNAEKELRQFIWVIPYQPDKEQEHAVTHEKIIRRATSLPRGYAPSGTKFITIGADVQKYLVYWLAIAWQDHANCHVLDYGTVERMFEQLGRERSVLVALAQVKDIGATGWPVAGEAQSEANLSIMQGWADSQYDTEYVHAFCREAGLQTWLPYRGFSEKESISEKYHHPHEKKGVEHLGEQYHIRSTEYSTYRADVNADHWKSFLQARILTPMAQPGALTLFAPSVERGVREHHKLAFHWTAEIKTTELVPARGLITKWERIRRENHWLDCAYAACAAGHYCGARLVDERPTKQEPDEPEQRFTTPDGRPYLITERN